MENPTDQIERHLSRASGSAVLAFAAATVAYAFKGVHWILDAYELRAAALDNFIGVIDWMGGPMDVGFYTFLASEGFRAWCSQLSKETSGGGGWKMASGGWRKSAPKRKPRRKPRAPKGKPRALKRKPPNGGIRELEKRLEDYERRNGS